MLLAKPVVPMIFGKDFSPAVSLMWIMLPGLILRSVSKILYYHFQGEGKPSMISAISFLSLAVLLGIDLVLIPLIGIKGAAIGTLCSCFVEFTVFSAIFLRKSEIKIRKMIVIQREDFQFLLSKVLKSRKAKVG